MVFKQTEEQILFKENKFMKEHTKIKFLKINLKSL